MSEPRSDDEVIAIADREIARIGSEALREVWPRIRGLARRMRRTSSSQVAAVLAEGRVVAGLPEEPTKT